MAISKWRQLAMVMKRILKVEYSLMRKILICEAISVMIQFTKFQPKTPLTSNQLHYHQHNHSHYQHQYKFTANGTTHHLCHPIPPATAGNIAQGSNPMLTNFTQFPRKFQIKIYTASVQYNAHKGYIANSPTKRMVCMIFIMNKVHCEWLYQKHPHLRVCDLAVPVAIANLNFIIHTYPVQLDYWDTCILAMIACASVGVLAFWLFIKLDHPQKG